MPSLEDRVSLIEERLKDQTALMADIRSGLTEIRSDIRHLGERMDRRFEQVDRRFEQVDQRFAQVDQRFAQVDQRFDQVDQRFDQFEHRFTWLVGIVVTGFIAVIGGLLAPSTNKSDASSRPSETLTLGRPAGGTARLYGDCPCVSTSGPTSSVPGATSVNGGSSAR